MVGSEDQSRQVSPMVDEFCRILEKRADLGSAMELSGLGLLASLHLQRGRIGRYIQSTRGSKVVDLAGLGLLGLPSAVDIYRSVKAPRRRKRKL